MPDLLHHGRFLDLLSIDGWEYVHRNNNSGVVVVVALTDDDQLVLVEQHRPAVRGRVLELPAGLSGDHEGTDDEPLVEAAKRELVEESGYAASSWVDMGATPLSAGLSDEVATFFLARGLTRVGEGGGDASEDIEVVTVPLRDLRAFLRQKRSAGVHVDVKIGAGLWLAEEHFATNG